MGLFDDKEEILDIQFTQWGKQQLAHGKFKPVFYTFSDEDVLYDANYGSITHVAGDAEDRILDNTVRTKPQYNFTGVETDYKNDVAQLNKDQRFLGRNQPEKTRTHKANSVLGNASYSSQLSPAWNIEFKSGEIERGELALTGAVSPVRIPQIDMKQITYMVNVIKNAPPEFLEQIRDQSSEHQGILTNNIIEFSDNTILELQESDIFINIQEENTMFNNDNFELELFLVEETVTNVISGSVNLKEEKLIPLHFVEKPFIRDDIYDEEEFFNSIDPELIDESNVEYYFTIESDAQISSEDFCKYVPQDRRQGIYGNYRECQDFNIALTPPRFRTDADNLEEPCDD